MTKRIADPFSVLRGHQSDVQCLDFDPTENYVASGDAQGEVAVWSLDSLRRVCVRKLHPVDIGVLNIKFLSSSQEAKAHILVTQGRNGDVKFWELDEDMNISRSPIRTIVGNTYSFCRFSILMIPNERHKLIKPTKVEGNMRDDGNSEEVNHEETFDISRNHEHCPCRIFLSSRYKTDTEFAIVAVPGRNEQELSIRCINCGESLANLSSPQGSDSLSKCGMVMAVKLFMKDEEVFAAVGFENGAIVVWNIRTPHQHIASGQPHTEPVMALDVDANGTKGISGSAETSIMSFSIDYESNNIKIEKKLSIKHEGISDVAVRPDGKLLATAGWDGRVRIYRRETGKPLAVLKYHSKSASCSIFSPRTYMIATSSSDGTIALYDLYPRN